MHAFAHHREPDPLRRAWAPVTIRVAWELHRAGARPTPAVLADARDHVLMSLPEDCEPEQAEELASALTAEYLGRVREGRYRARAPLHEDRPLPPEGRARLLSVLDAVGEVVLRLAYGDGLALETVERLTRVDRVVLRGAREGLRGALRAILAEEGVGEREVDAAELERMLGRLARLPAPDCQGGEEVSTPAGLSHAEGCPRCTRAVRLIKAGLLRPNELLPPRDRPVCPPDRVSVLVLHLHPDARHHRKLLLEQLGQGCLRADDDALLVDPDRVQDHVGPLHQLAEQGTPRRDHLRGALVRGPGRWTRAGLIGPVAAVGVELTRSRPWGEVDGANPLPEPLPEPPSAARWWSAALLVLLVAAGVGARSVQLAVEEPVWPLSARFERAEEGLIARFDADDRAYLLVVADGPEGLRVLHRSEHPADKGELGTGQGDFQITAPAQELLVVSLDAPVEDPQLLLEAVQTEAQPLRALEARLRSLHPRADFRRSGGAR